MDVLFTDISTENAEGTKTTYCELSCGTRSAVVIVTTGLIASVRVIVQNASHRTWGGMGKTFDSVEEALCSYKSAAVRAMIVAASQRAAMTFSF